jgi:hypothetical protein
MTTEQIAEELITAELWERIHDCANRVNELQAMQLVFAKEIIKRKRKEQP